MVWSSINTGGVILTPQFFAVNINKLSMFLRKKIIRYLFILVTCANSPFANKKRIEMLHNVTIRFFFFFFFFFFWGGGVDFQICKKLQKSIYDLK